MVNGFMTPASGFLRMIHPVPHYRVKGFPLSQESSLAMTVADLPDPHHNHPHDGSHQDGEQQQPDPAERHHPLHAVPHHLVHDNPPSAYSFTQRSRREFPTTDSELRLMAALAQMGLMRTPKNGYRTPAATGIVSVL